MQDDLQKQTRSRAAAQTRRRKRRIWVAGLCCAVAAATAYALTRPALTMTQQTFCGQEAHTHDESCYETILICGQDEQLPVEQPTPHVHTEDCYAAHLVLVCGQEESEEHTHTEDCCQTQYELICPLEEGEAEDEPEIPAHVHTDACYETRLICEKPEHTHSLSCYADAQAAFDAGDYEAAAAKFEALGNYKDAAALKREGTNLAEHMDALYRRFGWHEARVLSCELQGPDAMEISAVRKGRRTGTGLRRAAGHRRLRARADEGEGSRLRAGRAAL